MDEIAVENTARVIRDVNADILAVVEAENRVVLERFTTVMLNRVVKELPKRDRPNPYNTYMLIDGNDDRGIDVGLMTKSGYEIDYMRSHINDRFGRGLKRVVYSRDCPEFGVITPEEEWIWVLPNHFKSKFGGNDTASRMKRKAQAKRTKEIYEELIASGEHNVVVLGDLNDTPSSSPLQPLLKDTDLRDINEHSAFDSGEWPGVGTYGLGNDNDKLDYLLLSPELFERVTAGGLFRKGAWPGSRPVRWETYPEITEKIHVASDHHVIWAEIE